MPTNRIELELVHAADSLIQKGLSRAAGGDLRQAILCFQKAVDHAPNNDQAHYNLGLALKQSGDFPAAVRHYEVAASLAPNDADIYFNWGNALMACFDVRGAIDQFRKAIQLRPEAPDYLTNLAAALQEAGDLDGAITHFQSALKREPQSADRQWNLSLALLKDGRYKAAWPLFESRLTKRQWQANYPHRYPQPRWRGEPFRGRNLLVHFEQGFGDTLQFMRYLPMVKALGGRVTFEVPGPLLPLAKTMEGVDAAVEFSYEKPAIVAADLHIPLMSLAGLFSTCQETIPSQFPYLQSPSIHLDRWQEACDPLALNVGLLWAGKDTDPLRACGLKDLEPLLNLDGINWIGLQKGDAAEALGKSIGAAPVRNLGPELADFGDTAAVIHHLDLVVSVDTAVAHLAGAMGKPVFCLLRFASDWRWMAKGERTPWYPSMRLFRQEMAGEWSAPVRAMAAALSEMCRKRGRSSQKLAALQDQAAQGQGSALGEGGALQTLFEVGVRQSATGDLVAAINTYRKVLVEDPAHIPALFNLGICLRQRGDLDLAEEAYEAVLAIDADFTDACYNLANLYLSQERYSKAIALYKRVLEANPRHLDALLNLTVALWESDQYAAAKRYLEAALSNWPDSAAAHHHMGQLLSTRGRWPEALRYFRQAIGLAPSAAQYHYNYGHALYQSGHYKQAVKAFRQVLNDTPDHLPAKLNLGNALQELGAVDAAETCFAEALQTAPGRAETRWNLAIIRMLKGDYPSAWSDFEARWKKANWQQSYPFRYDLPRWQGQSLSGKSLFVHDEQGFGDVLQFARYLPLLKSMGGRVVFETRPPLYRLCAANGLADEVLLRGETFQPPEGCDYTIPLMSLPGIFGHGIDQIPNRVPYLTPPAESVARWIETQPKSSLKVGLVWSGRPTRPNEAPGLRGRSCGLTALKPLIDAHPEVSFIGLQQGPAADQCVELGMELENLGPELTDFADTAGVIAHLDLVISVDTAVAHLAGAMGRPVWILLQQVSDWRWLLNRSDSPWYPTARLFRQSVPGDWASLIGQVTPLLTEVRTPQ